MELKGEPAKRHIIAPCKICDGLFCVVCSSAEIDVMYCSSECEDADEKTIEGNDETRNSRQRPTT